MRRDIIDAHHVWLESIGAGVYFFVSNDLGAAIKRSKLKGLLLEEMAEV